MNQIEQCFEIEYAENVTTIQAETRKKCVVGHGTKIHYLAPNGKRASCGTGDVHCGNRRRSSVRLVSNNAQVTCETCLSKD